ncbi:hypothetical protein GF360_00695 [candidate division WWE3 bacterium]|nr:hypothetical protein [candidate division WWE3 bacterium]
MSALDYPYKRTLRQETKKGIKKSEKSLGTNPLITRFNVKKVTAKTALTITLTLLLGLSLVFTLNIPTFAKDCDDISDLDDRAACYEEKKEEKEEEASSIKDSLENLREKIGELSGKITNLASQINITQGEINSLQATINELEKEIEEINKNLKDRRTTMAEKEKLRNTTLRNLSKKNVLTKWEKFIGGSDDLASLNGFEYATFNYIFDRALSKNALNWIKVLNEEIQSFEADKAEALELKNEIAQEQTNLIAVKTQMDRQKAEAENVKGALDEEKEEKTEKLLSLEEEIAKLSEKQQAILSQKYGSGYVSGYESAEYKLPDCPFDKGFAVMSYGAFTHYKGMSQYGAKGRAKDGQEYKEIIKFYYGEDVKEKDDFPDEVCVQNYGDMDFQEYLYGLAEMHDSWPEDALKAQAIAARSYAYRYVKAGKCICTSQSCQVFLKSKSDNPPGDWKDAVDDTKDKIIGGSTDASGYGWYSSTAGGYIENRGWDSDGNWPGNAYEKKAESPWFYKAWHTQSYHSNSSTCGRSTPWLDEEELVDILNAWVVWRKGDDGDKDNISPVTTSCWGGDPYSMDKMREKAGDYGEKYTSISKVHTPSFASGRTTEICFETNRGKKCLDGEEFKTVFNLRAPGYVAIRSRLFDIEMDD